MSQKDTFPPNEKDAVEAAQQYAVTEWLKPGTNAADAVLFGVRWARENPVVTAELEYQQWKKENPDYEPTNRYAEEFKDAFYLGYGRGMDDTRSRLGSKHEHLLSQARKEAAAEARAETYQFVAKHAEGYWGDAITNQLKVWAKEAQALRGEHGRDNQ